jgi:hypothetical protein
MKETQKRSWDVAFGIVASFITALGIIVGVWEFNAGERNKITLEYALLERKDQIDFDRKLWLDRVSAYHDIADIAGVLAASTDDPIVFKKQVKKFDSAYWGLMILVEDTDVDRKMRELHFTIKHFEDHFVSGDRLRAKAAELGEACKTSINTRYKIIDDESQSQSKKGTDR